MHEMLLHMLHSIIYRMFCCNILSWNWCKFMLLSMQVAFLF